MAVTWQRHTEERKKSKSVVKFIPLPQLLPLSDIAGKGKASREMRLSASGLLGKQCAQRDLGFEEKGVDKRGRNLEKQCSWKSHQLS